MTRRRKEPLFVTYFDNTAQIHHGNTGRDMLDDSKIMGNKQIRQPKFILKILQ